MLFKAYPEPSPFQIIKSKVNLSNFPYQADLSVQFVSKIGKDPFYTNSSEIKPILFTQKIDPSTMIKFIMFIKPQQVRFPDDFTVMAKLGQGSFGQVFLVKYKGDGLLYALKIIKNISQKEIEQFSRFLIIQDNKYNNLVREILFLQELKTSLSQQQQHHPNFVQLIDYWYQPEQESYVTTQSLSTLPTSSSLNSCSSSMNDLDVKQSLIQSETEVKSYSFFIQMQYFGGIEYYATSLYDFFAPHIPDTIALSKQEEILPLHADLGLKSSREFIAQIFYQVLNAIQFMHDLKYCHRDIKDDNIVIRRHSGQVITHEEVKYTVPFVIDVALIDFGLTGYTDCGHTSLYHYLKNAYRDIENIEKYPIACDIYSLGELLKKLIALYHQYWFKLDENNLKIHLQQQNLLNEEYSLIDIMKSPIAVRPKSIQELKKTKEYTKWIEVIPKYIQFLFPQQSQQELYQY